MHVLRRVSTWILLALVWNGAMAGNQQAHNLSEFLASNPLKAADKPFLVVDPDRVSTKTGGSVLRNYDRMVAHIGGVTAIVPTEMVLIDDTFSGEPNLYDGLPEYVKVTYLLSTLTQDQLQKANSQGIGLDDLKGEQAKVLKSILPPKLDWETFSVNQTGGHGESVDGGTVASTDMYQVKLKIQACISMNVHFQNSPNSHIQTMNTMWNGRPGDKVTARKNSDELQTAFSLGLDPRRKAPNMPKSSQLRYSDSQFDAVVPLPAEAQLGDLVAAAGIAARTEIIADLRVGKLPVRTSGGNARSGDILKAIALCITGTYRKVDSAYVLTSDMIGLGARKLKLAAWKATFDKVVAKRLGLWRQKIYASGIYSKIGFDPQDPLAPDDNARRQMDLPTNGFDGISTGALTQSIRDFLGQVGQWWGRTNPVNQDKVGFESQIEYGFVLPNGKPLHTEIQTLGTKSSFAAASGDEPAQHEEEFLEPFPGDSTASHPLVVSAESPLAATKLVSLAHAHGFTELWLESHDKATLESALGKGVKVDLVLRPWERVGGQSVRNADLNIWGDTGSQLAERREGMVDWKQCQDLAGMAFGECPPIYDLLCPTDPVLNSSQAVLADLAHTKGLAGTVVLDTEPAGYEAADGNTLYVGFSRVLAVLHEFGYSPALRLSFLREKRVDPIDLAPSVLTLDFNIQQPFFLDDRLGVWNVRTGKADPDMAPLLNDWFAFRSKLNIKAVNAFLNRLSDLSIPILIAPRMAIAHTPPYMTHCVVPWKPEEPLPQVTDDKLQSLAGRILLYGYSEQSPQATVLTMARMMQSPKIVLAVDATGVKPEALDEMISRWFTKPTRKEK